MTDLLPICVDLDGTLIHDDVTIRALRIFVRQNWFHIFLVFVWFLHGRAYLKYQLAKRVRLDPRELHYNDNFLQYIRDKKQAGYKVFLATACNMEYARIVADYLEIFDDVFASDKVVNLRAEEKANALMSKFGNFGFIYAGNSKDDVAVWKHSAESILVTPTKSALNAMRDKQYTLFN